MPNNIIKPSKVNPNNQKFVPPESDQKDVSDLDSSGSSSGAGADSDSPGNGYYSDRPHNQHYGSFYLRVGAVAFGIGSMIYSGLEFGQYFELEQNTKCHNIMVALTPATRMAFIFIQMYFIFLNNEVGTQVLSI